MVMERSSRIFEEEMPNCEFLRVRSRLPEEGTPKLVLKEEQGLVKAEEGSLADETGSDEGWPGTQSTRHRICGREWRSSGLEPQSHPAQGHSTEVHRRILLGLAFS